MSLGEINPLDFGSIESGLSKEVTIMVVGRNGAGKSTALNNIFGLHLETDSGPNSVTTDIVVNHIKQNDTTLHIIDIPGMGDLNIPEEEIIKKMKSQEIQGDFILLLCISVSPGSRLNVLDAANLKSLHSAFGRDIWNNCFPLFTFSDLASMHENNVDAYRRKLEFYCQSLKRIFHDLGILQDVTTIYGYNNLEHFRSAILGGMVALPVGLDDSVTKQILPGLTWVEDLYWTEIAFLEIVKKASRFSLALVKVKHRDLVDNVKDMLKSGFKLGGGAIGGGAIGGSAGILIGEKVGGKLAVAAGKKVGAAVGTGLGIAVADIVLALLHQ